MMTTEEPALARENQRKAELDPNSKARLAIEFARQAERLALYTRDQENKETGSTQAVEARFITAQDPVIITADGGRLPAVPVDEAIRLNCLRDRLEGRDAACRIPVKLAAREAKDGTIHGVRLPSDVTQSESTQSDAPLGTAAPLSKTNPLFPPLPTWGPPSFTRNMHSIILRTSSAVLSLCFLLVIIMGSMFTSVPILLRNINLRLRSQDPAKVRPFYSEETRLAKDRRCAEWEWENQRSGRRKSMQSQTAADVGQNGRRLNGSGERRSERFIPTEGGPDALVCDVGYYARRVGLDCETFLVETEDGFIIELWHLFNPLTAASQSSSELSPKSPNHLTGQSNGISDDKFRRKYPVLLIHGLLQSSGAYCCTDENSLAFFLAKSGLDVWLGNNRCGFTPRHTLLKTSDARMWAWNIRQMGVMDLPALISRVLSETGFSKLALVAHSQGTTQTMVALAKEQRPEIGDKISVVCLLAPAAYAGPLIGKMYFKFMRIITPGMFRAIFGIHAFIPFMMKMHSLLPRKFYGFMGYRVFSFLFNWTDERWDRELRDRCFQFAPVYVSAESMRWWLGRECFATHKCILSTKQESEMENLEDEESDEEEMARQNGRQARSHDHKDRGRFAWYDEHVPPFALWVAGADELVDGRRLLRRFDRGREPHVEVVHSSVIEGYEHLDVLWAIDSLDKVGREVLQTIWRTMPEDARNSTERPVGCESLVPWEGRKRSV